jgi:predicted GIY-YIG superfamily endonuclease
MCGDLKPSLIDLEAGDTATGRKLILKEQRERLSEKDIMYCVYWVRLKTHSDVLSEGYVGISKNFKERMRFHRKNKKKTILTQAIHKYGWGSLVKEILYNNLTQEEALFIESSLRNKERIGWNLQQGGFIGINPEWYDTQENRDKHSKATSEKTILGIQKKDTKEARSNRAKLNWINNKESYKDISKGSNNPKALLTEEQVKEIKYILIPSGKTNSEIASLFFVKSYVISFIRSGKNWKHI